MIDFCNELKYIIGYQLKEGEKMKEYKQIDSILLDATNRVTIGDAKQSIDSSGIPHISDEVSLDTNKGYPMMVRVSWMSDDKETFRGKVTHGYYPKEKNKQIDVDALVEFSMKKIGGIFKSKKIGKISKSESEKNFGKFLDKKEEEMKALPKSDWKAEKKEWLLFLDILYKSFEAYLKDYINRGIKITYDEIELTEENFGTYKAKRMLINIAGEIVRLQPIGTNIIGAKGRVDMLGSGGSVMLVLVDSRIKGIRDNINVSELIGHKTPLKRTSEDKTPVTWEWRFVTAPPTRQYQPVNKQTIYSAIMELSNVPK
jgi:hypothetical protein